MLIFSLFLSLSFQAATASELHLLNIIPETNRPSLALIWPAFATLKISRRLLLLAFRKPALIKPKLLWGSNRHFAMDVSSSNLLVIYNANEYSFVDTNATSSIAAETSSIAAGISSSIAAITSAGGSSISTRVAGASQSLVSSLSAAASSATASTSSAANNLYVPLSGSPIAIGAVLLGVLAGPLFLLA